MHSNAPAAPVASSPTDRFLGELRNQTSWLVTPWGASKMVARFGPNNEYHLDFSLEAFAGQFASTHARQQLINDIYDFLCVQSHHSANSKHGRSANTQKESIKDALYIVDYLLLNGQRLNVFDFGFGAVIGMHLKQLLVARASTSDLLTGLMQWPRRLANFLTIKARSLSAEAKDAAISECPQLAAIDVPEEERVLGLTEDLLIRARCWLWHNGYYRVNYAHDYLFTPSFSRLGKQVYAGTIWIGREEVKKSAFDELCVGPTERQRRECPGVPVRSSAVDDACGQRDYARFKRILLRSRLIANVGCGFPLKSLDEAEAFELSDAVRLKPDGRYVSVPPAYALKIVGNGITFFLEHSRHLLSSYANAVIAAKAASKSISQYVSERGIVHLLHPTTKMMGVVNWSVSENLNAERLSKRNRDKVPPAQFFRCFRDNQGLRECVQALYGAMQLAIGLLMAARQGELLDLPLACLDESREWMSLLSRKTGFDGLRDEDERPIPYIGARIVRRINAFHKLLRNHGVKTPDALFALPNIDGGFSLSTRQYNRAIDQFIDYVEAPKTADGKRYYIRQHQLRRLFALLFYLAPYYGGLEDLQWMLRHIDPRHLEHYITHALPGAQLSSIKAEALSIVLRDNEEKLLDLKAFVNKHFGTRNIDLMTFEGFQEYVSYLTEKQDDDSLVVSPVFYDTPDGCKYRIALAIFED